MAPDCWGFLVWEVIKLSNLTPLLSALVMSSLFLKQQFSAAIKVHLTDDLMLKMPVLKVITDPADGNKFLALNNP